MAAVGYSAAQERPETGRHGRQLLTDPWRVLIVEDDPTVARVHCRLVSRAEHFQVVGVAQTASQAVTMVRNLQPDLVLLDFGLPGASGLALLREMRRQSASVEVIAVTAASSAKIVRHALHLGVIDYLVKPFLPERLHQALDTFERTMLTLQSDVLEQHSVDALCGAAHTGARQLPKDLGEERLREIRAALMARDAPLSAEELAGALGIARSTARRYLEYLVELQEVTVATVVNGPGRPRKAYRAWTSAPVADGG